MKNPNTGKTFLNLEDINTILPPELVLDSERVSRGIYRSANGSLISISNSKYYEKGYAAWYFVYIDRYKKAKVNYMLFTIGLSGIVLVPMSLMERYKCRCTWKDGRFPKEKRYRIDIQINKEGEHLFVNSSDVYPKKMSVEKYFIPFSEVKVE